MTVYVDQLLDNGWVLRGYAVKNCHMFTDDIDLTELHAIAQNIGLKRAWAQVSNKQDPHYDLTPKRREAAIKAGAIAVENDTAVEIWRVRREKVKNDQKI